MILFILANLAFAGVDESQLVEIHGATNPKCVEYFLKNNKAYCSTRPLTHKAPKPSAERLSFDFDNRLWALAFELKENAETHEYVLTDESIENWKELVTTHNYPNVSPTITAKQLANAILDSLKKQGFSPKVTVHQNNENDYIFEWQLSAPSEQIQDEIQRIFKVGPLLHSIRYTQKKYDMGSVTRTDWISRVKKAKVKK